MLKETISLVWDYAYETRKQKAKLSGRIYLKTKHEIFLHWNTKCFLQKVLGLLCFGSCQNWMNSANLIAEIQLKLSNERALSPEEPCTCKYVTIFQSFHRGTLSIHYYIAQNWSIVTYSQVHGSPVLKTLSFESFNWISAIRLAEFI